MTTPFQPHSDTSREAAEAATAFSDTGRQRVLEAIRAAGRWGRTDEELADILKMNPSTVRPRRISLVEDGLVCDSGEKRKTKSGRSATVWTATKPGEQLRLF